MSSIHDFVESLKQQLEDLDYQFDRFEHRVDDLARDARTQAKQLLQDVRTRRSELKDKLEKVEQQSSAAIDDVKDGLEIAWDGLKTAFYAVRSEFEKDDD